ncbi:hypothetical protein CcCBS67573_g02103 [Chytriomyces confervae]|uniref:Chitin-binding type-3 domain-containing protein n=1 Tax=Chytriomyces confervae TaxID=246404 RepID=A0A507FMR7_9FUNG|nr:hypothetical protein HDU80_009371 [Chytriomyces hyalinus]TPX76606.1 hypothetical protein CcCBS67573_g02103 [Chytriomyces confervae]
MACHQNLLAIVTLALCGVLAVAETSACFPAYQMGANYADGATVSYQSANFKLVNRQWKQLGTCTVDAAPLPLNTPKGPAGGDCFVAWNPSKAPYFKGDKVSYKNMNYESAWWVGSYDVPGASQYNGWVSKGACTSANDETTSTVRATSTSASSKQTKPILTSSTASESSSTKVTSRSLGRPSSTASKESPPASKPTTTVKVYSSTPTTAVAATKSPAPAPANACPVGSRIRAVTSQRLQARVGSIHGNVLYDPSNESNNPYRPTSIQVQVTGSDGKAIQSCPITWTVQQATTHGWVYPESEATDNSGQASAFWVAGTQTSGPQILSASIINADNTVSTVTFSSSVTPHKTRANSIHVNWDSPTWTKFRMDLVPHAWPASTYYEAIGIQNGYCGIQNDRILFSMWEKGGKNPEVIRKHEKATCADFGGEGTGIQCRVYRTPAVDVTYTFEMTVADAPGGLQDYTVSVKDGASGEVTEIATLRFQGRQDNRGAYGFVEDFYEQTESCLEAAVRAVTFKNVEYVDAKSGKSVRMGEKNAYGTAVFTPNHNEVCVNYKFNFENGEFWAGSGGVDMGTPLNMPGGDSVYRQ